jgi:hypothetical protein
MNEQEILDRAKRAAMSVDGPDHPYDALLRRRDRNRRNQRIAAGVVGIAVFVAAVWIVTSGLSLDRSETSVVPGGGVTGPTGSLVPNSTGVNVINLPPEGAPPSSPEHGELVLSVEGRGIAADSALTRMYLYADGRLIWWREGDLPPGATGHDILEQRLTPEGVELVRSEVVSSRLIDPDPDSGVMVDGEADPDPFAFLGFMRVRDADRLVGREFAHEGYDTGGPHRVGETTCRPAWGCAHIATAEEESAIKRLTTRLADPASWLPASAWADQGIKIYVPTTYRVCYGGTAGTIKRDRLLHAIPGPVQELLEARDAEKNEADFNEYISFGDWVDGARATAYCSELTTEEARDVVRGLDDAGFEREQFPTYANGPTNRWYAHATFEYIFSVPDPTGEAALWIDPNFPHGAVCITC